MIFVVAYLISFLIVLGVLWSFELREVLPPWIAPHRLIYNCALIGGLGGVVYCLRAVYLNRSVRNRWDSNWTVWYVLRPIVSCLVGGVAYIFLSAGLLILGAEQASGSSSLGFIALSFVAGLNVDRFLVRIEEIARSTWGIRPSRTAEESHGADSAQREDEARPGR